MASTPLPPSIDSTFGAILLGLVVGSVLFGLTTLQTHVYFQRFPNDNPWLKGFVATVWIIDFLHVILCSHVMYHYLVTGFGDHDNLNREVWSMALQTDCNGVIGMAVELFFARRVYKLSRNWVITGIISVFAVIHFTLGIYFTVQGFVLKEFSKFAALTWVTCVGLGSAAAADVIIAIALVYALQNVRTGIARTDTIITTLIKYAINTGAVTSIVATICVFCFAFMPTNFVWLSFFWILGKLYSNSLLANLNGREALRGRGRSEDAGSVVLPMSRVSGMKSPQKARFSFQPGALRVNVTTETTIHGRERASPISSSTSDSPAAPWAPRRLNPIETFPEFAKGSQLISKS